MMLTHSQITPQRVNVASASVIHALLDYETNEGVKGASMVFFYSLLSLSISPNWCFLICMIVIGDSKLCEIVEKSKHVTTAMRLVLIALSNFFDHHHHDWGLQ